VLVCVGRRGLTGSPVYAHVVEIAALHRLSLGDFTKGVRPGDVRKKHGDELAAAADSFCCMVFGVLLDDVFECFPADMP
jgi:hypothetical protein